MASTQNQNGPPLPSLDATAAEQGKNSNALSSVQHQDKAKRNQRHRKNHSQSVPQIDGTVSDSVTNPMASRSKKGPKQRQQSVAIGAPVNENSNMARANGHPPRHTSVGGNMLPATPSKEQHYAGPTFQASPAPSSLPVPKFFSKSVPNIAAKQSLEARMAGERTPDTESSSPEPDVVSPSRASQQSPLDLLFKADKAEKEEKRRSSSMLSPEMAARQPSSANRGDFQDLFQRPAKNTFLQEMDGDMPSPRSVPQSGRPPLAQRASSSPRIQTTGSSSESEREAYTKSLKDLLFNNINSASPQSSTPHTQQRPRSNPRPDEYIFNTPSPFHRSTSGPSTPTPNSEQQNHYSLHYGNRNLSPLFKAARNETPARPSSLRQHELASDVSSNTDSSAGVRLEPRQPPQIDPNSFSRNYIDQQYRASQPTSFPQIQLSNGIVTNPNNTTSRPSSGIPSQHGVQASTSGSAASPRTSGSSHDITKMEDDLRRMLKLNVLSN